VTLARALVLLAAALLGIPGLFVAAKGLAAIRRRSAVVQGRTVLGARAVLAGFVLLLWAAAMMGFATVVLAAQWRR
jgi:hypothetical protein